MAMLVTMKQAERLVESNCSPMQKATMALCAMMAVKRSHTSREVSPNATAKPSNTE